RRVVLVGDGPTLTHGGMPTGAGTLAAERFGAAQVVDPRPYLTNSLAATFRQFAHLEYEIPAMGYSPAQVADLEATLARIRADVIVDATAVNLARLIQANKPIVDVGYEFQERGDHLPGILEMF